MKRIVILISGRGSNMESLLNAVSSGALPVRVAAVLSNRPDAKG
ncbi:MAG: formyltransferase family protein, partial [Acidobacteriota bacterium]